MGPVTNVLVPIDFSRASKVSLRYACRLAESLGAAVHVMHVTVNPSMTPADEFHPLPPGWFEVQEEVGRTELAKALTAEEQARYRAVLVHRSGDPATEIVAYLDAHPEVDLVVMATHGRGGVARLMMGSVADKIVRVARCPVLTMRVGDEPDAVEPA